jgi:hypothetical protein
LTYVVPEPSRINIGFQNTVWSMLDSTKRDIIALLVIYVLAATLPHAGATGVYLEDARGDFTTVTGLAIKKSFLDIRSVSVDYDGPSDRVLVTVGFYDLLPSEGPSDGSDVTSDYFYTCHFQTGENATLDGASVILGKDANWTAALLTSHIRGNTLDDNASPAKYRVGNDSITFMIPAHIPAWGARPTSLLLMIETGYESFTLQSGETYAAYYDRAPEADPGPGSITFEIPAAAPNYVPVAVLAVVLASTSALTWRFLHKRGGARHRARG